MGKPANKQLVFPPSTGRVNMRGLILLLPALLVLFLAPGSARTEEESSLVGDADLPSNILPLSEKVEGREAREAAREKPKKKKKKKKKQKKKAKKEKEREEAKRKKKLAKKRRNKLRKSEARQAAGGDWSS